MFQKITPNKADSKRQRSRQSRLLPGFDDFPCTLSPNPSMSLGQADAAPGFPAQKNSRDHAAAPNASQNRWPNWNLGWEMMTMGLGSLTTGIFAGALLTLAVLLAMLAWRGKDRTAKWTLAFSGASTLLLALSQAC